MSAPLLTFSHSSTTVPLKAAGSAGRRTTTRVRYAACGPGSSSNRPSPGSVVELDRHAVAVPDTESSDSRSQPWPGRVHRGRPWSQTPLPPTMGAKCALWSIVGS